MIVGQFERVAEVGFLVGGEDSSLGHFKPLVVRVIYFEVELVVGECFEMEDKFFDDDTFGFDIVLMLSDVFEVQFDIGTPLIFGSNCILPFHKQ